VSERYKEQYYRATCTPGSTDTATTVKLAFGHGVVLSTTGIYINRLIPGSAAGISTRFIHPDYTSLSLWYEGNTPDQPATGQQIQHDNYMPHIYPNGDVMSWALHPTGKPEMEFYNRAANTWTVITGKNVDTATASDFRPLRLSDGALAGVFVYYKGTKAYLAVADADPGAPPAANRFYHSRFLDHKAELNADFSAQQGPRIFAIRQDGPTVTVVVATYTDGGSAKKVHAYQWTEGAAGFTTLYSGVPITEADNLILQYRAECTPSGTLYKWQYYPGNSKLLTVDAGGTHTYGAVGDLGSVSINAVHWLNGAYYGVAFPGNGQPDSDHNLHMEILKLK
jgi:hypothetical protein